MKNKIIVCAICWLYSYTVFSQNRTDTLILSREIRQDGSYRVVFIDAGKNSSYRKEIRQLPFDPLEYTRQLQELKDSLKIPIKRHAVSGIPKTWYSLYLYRNKYYLYKPSDPGTSPWLRFTDSTLLELYFDPGVVTSILTGVKKRANNVQLNFSNMTDRAAAITIHSVDPARGIAVIERHYGPEDIKYTLMVSEDKLHLYSVIVNYNKDSRVEEWEFDKPDYKKLLKRRPAR